ncbi:unnamed protein product [Penicillium bialowiezense]
MARKFLRGQNITLGLSLFLFIFMFLPTFVILLGVVVFFGLIYPRLRMETRRSDVKESQPTE